MLCAGCGWFVVLVFVVSYCWYCGWWLVFVFVLVVKVAFVLLLLVYECCLGDFG